MANELTPEFCDDGVPVVKALSTRHAERQLTRGAACTPVTLVAGHPLNALTLTRAAVTLVSGRARAVTAAGWTHRRVTNKESVTDTHKEMFSLLCNLQ